MRVLRSFFFFRHRVLASPSERPGGSSFHSGLAQSPFEKLAPETSHVCSLYVGRPPQKKKGPDAPLQIVFTIHGGKDLEEKILPHLEGYRGAAPVRIGNGAADHLQLDVYGGEFFSIIPPLGHSLLSRRSWLRNRDGLYVAVMYFKCRADLITYDFACHAAFVELMDSVYLFNKYGKPCSWEAWADIRLIVDYVCDLREPAAFGMGCCAELPFYFWTGLR